MKKIGNEFEREQRDWWEEKEGRNDIIKLQSRKKKKIDAWLHSFSEPQSLFFSIVFNFQFNNSSCFQLLIK